MDKFIGTTFAKAKEMTRLEYNQLRGWNVPKNEDGTDKGYLVEDLNSGHVNWQPVKNFEKTFKPAESMTFGQALIVLKSKGRVARKGWNGKNMFLFLVDGSKDLVVNREPLLSILGEGTKFDYQPHVDMKTANGSIVPWLCSQSDMLAEDWEIVPDA